MNIKFSSKTFLLVLAVFAFGLLAGMFLKSSSVFNQYVSSNVSFQRGDAISFSFDYPVGYQVLSGVFESESSSVYLEKFYLNNGPIWFFPHSEEYLYGTVMEATETEFKDKEREIAAYDDAVKLNWANPNLEGSCYSFSSGEEGGGMYGKVENNVSCAVFIKQNQFNLETRLFVFEILNSLDSAEKIDPGYKIAQRFFESLIERSN